MINKKKLWLMTLLYTVMLLVLIGCVGGPTKFTGFYLQVEGREDYYALDDNVTIHIIESGGVPQGYNVYEKLGEEPYASLLTLSNSSNKFTVALNTLGEVSIKVAPVVSGVERDTFEELTFTVMEQDDFDLREIHIKNNIVDLYYNVENYKNNYNINEEVQIVYVPKHTSYDLQYDRRNNACISTTEGIVQAIAYSENEPPLVIPFYYTQNPNIKANMYFRVSNSVTKGELTKIFAGYVDKKYYTDDWVDIQVMEYGGMQAPEGYIVSKRTEEGVYEDLIDTALNAEIMKVEEYGEVHHKVKATATSSDYMYLRIFAIKNGVKSDVYTDIEIRVYQQPSEIVLEKNKRTLLLDQEYQINATVLPINTYDKSITFEILDDGEDYILIDNSGKITPIAPTVDPVKIKIISNQNHNIYAQFEVSVLDKLESDFNLSHDKPLIQQIGFVEDINLAIDAENVEAVEWLLDDVLVSSEKNFTYQAGEPPYMAYSKILIAKAIIGDAEVYIQREIVLESLFEFVDLDNVYSMDSLVDLKYEILSTEIDSESISVQWDIYTRDGTEFATTTNDSFLFEVTDEYQIQATFRKNGIVLERKISPIISIVDGLSHEVVNVHTNGYYDGTNYAPLLKWGNLPFGVGVTVQVIMGAQTKEYSSSNPLYKDMFGSDYFQVPYGDFKLSNTFKYRVKTNISNRYTSFVYYDGSIASQHYVYLKDLSTIIEGFPQDLTNSYITNLYDLSKIINYIQLFREGKTTNVELYFAVNYEDIKNDYYKFGDAVDTETEDADLINYIKIIKGAMDAYGACAELSFDINKKNNNDIRCVELIFHNPACAQPNPTIEYEPSDWIVIYEHSYPNSRGEDNQEFPILNNTRTMSVKTSNELLLAVSWGIRPIPENGSSAEQIYNKAKKVLNQIIDNAMSDAEKAIAIYEYLCLEIKYDNVLYEEYMSGQGQSQNALASNRSFHLEGVFEDKRAVCDGISKAFVLLTAIENIKAIKVSGRASSEGTVGEEHAWNMVLLNGNWYFVDATWGRFNPPPLNGNSYIGVNHYYFSPTKEEFTSHIHRGEIPLPATERLYDYFVGNSLYFENDNDLIEAQSLLEVGEDGLFCTFVIGYDFSIYNNDLGEYIQSRFSTLISPWIYDDYIIILILFNT